MTTQANIDALVKIVEAKNPDGSLRFPWAKGPAPIEVICWNAVKALWESDPRGLVRNDAAQYIVGNLHYDYLQGIGDSPEEAILTAAVKYWGLT